MISHDKITLFGHRRITAFCQLPDDYRGLGVLLRPDKSRHPLFALIHIISEICINFIFNKFSTNLLLDDISLHFLKNKLIKKFALLVVRSEF